MAIWTEPTGVIAHGTLLTVAGEEVYFETATITAVARLSLTGDPRIYVETVTAAAISAVSAADIGGAIGAVAPVIAVAVGTGLTGTINQGEVVLPLPEVSTGPFKSGEISIPLATVSGTVPTVYSGTANLTLFSPIVTGQMTSGPVSTGAVRVPLARVNGVFGSSAFVQPSIFVVAATGLTGGVGRASVRNAFAQVSGIASQEAFTVGEAVLPLPVALGQLLRGTQIVGDVQNRFSVVSGLGVSGGISSGTATLPLTAATAILISEVLSTGEVLLSVPTVRGEILVILSNSVTWVLNTESNKASNYTQFPFIALGHLGANPVGATADGLYLLSGDNDNGQAIDSVFKFGMTDFRSELVNNSDVYVGGDIESDMEVSIREDGQEEGNTYLLSERERHVRGHHAKIGKGFRARHRQLSISNVSGGNFDLDSLSLSSRDLRGNE